MDARVYELLNDQINKELYSSYLYLSFADYYEEEGLEGFANWYEIQAKEERDHALIFRNYLHENGCKVKLLAIDQPDKEFTTFLEPLEARKHLRAIAPPPMRGRFFVYSEPRYCQKSRADDESGAPLRFMP